MDQHWTMARSYSGASLPIGSYQTSITQSITGSEHVVEGHSPTTRGRVQDRYSATSIMEHLIVWAGRSSADVVAKCDYLE